MNELRPVQTRVSTLAVVLAAVATVMSACGDDSDGNEPGTGGRGSSGGASGGGAPTGGRPGSGGTGVGGGITPTGGTGGALNECGELKADADEAAVGTSVDLSFTRGGFDSLDYFNVSEVGRAVLVSKGARALAVECLEPGPVTVSFQSASCSGTSTTEITCTESDNPSSNPHPDLGEGGAPGNVAGCSHGKGGAFDGQGSCDVGAVNRRLMAFADDGASGSGGAGGSDNGSGTSGDTSVAGAGTNGGSGGSTDIAADGGVGGESAVTGGAGEGPGEQSCDASGTWHVWFPAVNSCDSIGCTGAEQPPQAHLELRAPAQLEVSGDGCELTYQVTTAWASESECGAHGYRLTLSVEGDEATGLLHRAETGLCSGEQFIGALARRIAP